MASALKTQLQDDLKKARKAREKLRILVLSTTLSDLRNHEIELGREAEDSEVQAVITKAVKRRRDAAAQMRSGGRDDLADREESEAEMLSVYLPEALTEEEVRQIVRAIVEEGMRDMGPVMGRLMPRLKGRFDGRDANRIVREVLSE